MPSSTSQQALREGLTLLVSLLALGCTAYLPSAQAPEAIAPVLAESPRIEPGTQRLLLDVVDGPTDVFSLTSYRQRYRNSDGELRTRRRTQRDIVCRTPCAVDLPEGRYVLGFPMHGGGSRLEREEIYLGPQTLAHRRNLGSFWGAGAGLPLGILGATFGGMALVVGAVFLPVGLASGEDGMTIAGGINAGAGAALLTLGILGIVLDPDVIRRGAGVTFPVQ